MESIKNFLKININYIDGYGYGSANGYGYGSANGSGDGSGSGYGSYLTYFNQQPEIIANGSGSGSGYGYGYGNGSGYASSDGYGNGYDYDDGSGSGSGSSYEIKSFNNQEVYLIDSIQTIISSVKGNIAKGFILNNDLTLTECYIVKENNIFSHGQTLHEAFASLQEKLFDNIPESERIEKFKDKFKDFSLKYDAKELFIWHHILTGSCKTGRESFCLNNGINIETDKFTIYEFIELTKNSYNNDIIKKLL